MNIEKIIKLIDNKNYKEARFLLENELINKKDTKKAKLITTIHKYLKNIKNYDNLKKIFISPTDKKQFIIDGYSLYVFNKKIIEDKECSENDLKEKILTQWNNKPFTKINDKELLLLKNIKNYIKLSKLNKETNYIYFANTCYDGNFLKTLTEMFENDIENIEIIREKDRMTLKNNNTTCYMIGVKTSYEKDIIEKTENFIKRITQK